MEGAVLLPAADGRHYTSACSSLLYIKLFSGWSVTCAIGSTGWVPSRVHVPSLHVPAQCPGLLQVPRASEQHTCTSADCYHHSLLPLDILTYVCLYGDLSGRLVLDSVGSARGCLCWLARVCGWSPIRTSDHVFGYTSGLLWILFAYV